MSRVAIIGDGGWGTALSLVLHRNRHEVTVWGPFEEGVRAVSEARENKAFLPGVSLPPEIGWTSDLSRALTDSDVCVLAVPSRYFRGVMGKMAVHDLSRRRLLVSVTKGFDEQTHQRMTQVAGTLLRDRAVAALSGPSLAAEVARGIPTAVTVACAEASRAEALQKLFNTPAFRVYTSDDVIGVELGGALKNVMALAAGVCDGIGFGDNSKAALITRGLAEMARLGKALGAHPATFAGLSGMGDLVVTCTSKLSRNRGVGERLGRGEKLPDILKGMKQVAEGLWTCGTARALAAERGVDVPIIDEVYAVVHEGKNPRQAFLDLMGREPRPERDH